MSITNRWRAGRRCGQCSPSSGRTGASRRSVASALRCRPPRSPRLPLVVEKVVDNGIAEHSKGWVYGCAAVAALLVVAQVVGSWLEVAYMGRFAEGYQKNLRASMMEHLYSLDLDYFTREPAGRLVSRLTSDVENLQQFVQGGLSLVLTRRVAARAGHQPDAVPVGAAHAGRTRGAAGARGSELLVPAARVPRADADPRKPWPRCSRTSTSRSWACASCRRSRSSPSSTRCSAT